MTKAFLLRGGLIHLLSSSDGSPCGAGYESEPIWKHCSPDLIRKELRQLGDGALLRLRGMLQEIGVTGLEHFSENQVLDQIAARIHNGTIRAVRCVETIGHASDDGSQPGTEEKTAQKVGKALPSGPKQPEPSANATEKTWIEVRLVDSAGNPVSGKAYRLTLPDGRVNEGKLGADGVVRLTGIDPGTCQVCFTEMDAGDWREA